MLTAITRAVSPNINLCELSFYKRQPIDVHRAIDQHAAYEQLLWELGVRVISLPSEPDLPDAVFVEDPAVVLDEVAVISRMGAASRRAEAESLAEVLSHYRRLEFLTEPATLDGGDVMRIGRDLYVGVSARTNRDGVEQLTTLLRPYDYEVRPVGVRGCLHLKSGCSYVGNHTVLVNRAWMDSGLTDVAVIDVPNQEPGAANALLVKGVVILPASFPKTRALLEEKGFEVRSVELSELQKAEGGVTCTSLIFDDLGEQPSAPAQPSL